MFRFVYKKEGKLALSLLAVSLTILIKGSVFAATIIPSPDNIGVLNGLINNSLLINDSAQNPVNNTDNQESVSFHDSLYTKSNIVISTGKLTTSSPISRLDYGANIIWYDGGYGTQNLENDQIYKGVVEATKQIGISALRYPGGIPSDTFNWQSAIGPQDQRQDNVVYQSGNNFLPSTFGPDEFGNFLNDTAAEGDITVNFGTGTAQSAANFVQYMTASSKTNYWGKLRAENGHPAPYNVPYWEVGNEVQTSSGENYWRSGSVVSIDDNNHCASSDIHLCEYVYGGVTEFKKQRVIPKSSSVSYVEYPPVVRNSQSVYVSGELVNPVTSFKSVNNGKLAYEFDNSTGEISFNTGIPKGIRVTVSYQSGPHDGFDTYYKLMKSADPKAQVCASYEASDFIQLMGSSSPYDCFVTHLYAGKIPNTATDASLFHNGILQQSFEFANRLSSEQNTIKKYAGNRANKINIVVSEYGVNARTYPADEPDYHRSQDMALFVANTLKIIIDAHIPLAEKHYLISYEFSQPSGVETYVNSPAFANNALIGGPGPNPVLQPSAYVIEAYSKLLYSNLISSNTKKNPTVVYSQGSYPALSTIATTDKTGKEAIMIMNLSESQNITASINPSVSTYTRVKSWTLGSTNSLNYNTPSNQHNVGFVEKNNPVYNGKVVATFPSSSVTVLQFSN